MYNRRLLTNISALKLETEEIKSLAPGNFGSSEVSFIPLGLSYHPPRMPNSSGAKVFTGPAGHPNMARSMSTSASVATFGGLAQGRLMCSVLIVAAQDLWVHKGFE